MVAKKPARSTSLVVSAIRKLRDIQGTSSREIMNFIASEYGVSGASLKRNVQMALKRGMSCGIIEKAKGGYYLSNPNAVTISCDTLVDRGRRGGCGKRRKRKKCASKRRRKCGRRRSRRARRRRRGKGKCGSKRRRRRRRGKRGCGRRGRRRGGDEEMDEMALTTLARVDPKRRTRMRRGKYEQRSGVRNKTLSDRYSTRSSTGSLTRDNRT